jgi:hypothetical protein
MAKSAGERARLVWLGSRYWLGFRVVLVVAVALG